MARRPTHRQRTGALMLEDDPGTDSLALAELTEVISAKAVLVIPGEEAGLVRTVGDLQDILHAHARGTGTT